MEKKAAIQKDIGGAIMDAFCDYGGVNNVVTGLMAIASAINRLSDILDREYSNKNAGSIIDDTYADALAYNLSIELKNLLQSVEAGMGQEG